MSWILCCIAFLTVLSTVLIVPVCRHATLPRRKKFVLSLTIFITLVPIGLLVYAWVGIPPMAML